MKPNLFASPIKFIVILLLSASCFSIKEEIFLNADGSGKYLVYTDMIGGSRNMMIGMMQSMNPEADTDSLMRAIDDQLWQEYPSVVDSIIDFSDKVPDSIKNDPDKQQFLERMEIFMEGSREKGYMNSGLRFSFKSMDDLEALMKLLDESSKNSAGGPPMPSTQIDYSFDKNSFSRKALLDAEDEMINDSSIMAMSAMLKESSWRLIVHLPEKAKKASKEQLVSKDGKDVIYEYDLLKIISGEQTMDMKIEF